MHMIRADHTVGKQVQPVIVDAENRAYRSYKGTFDALVANGVDPAKARTLASSASSQIVESQAKIEKMRQSKRDYYANAYFKNK